MEALTMVLLTWLVVSVACAVLLGPLLRGFGRLSTRHETPALATAGPRVALRTRPVGV